jgi:hypothetical protein
VSLSFVFEFRFCCFWCGSSGEILAYKYFYCRNGKVAHGVLDILKELPIVKVGVGDLPGLVGSPGMFTRCLELNA